MPRCISSYERTARAYLKRLGSGAEITRLRLGSPGRSPPVGPRGWILVAVIKMPSEPPCLLTFAGLKKLFASDPLLCFFNIWNAQTRRQKQSRRMNCVKLENLAWAQSSDGMSMFKNRPPKARGGRDPLTALSRSIEISLECHTHIHLNGNY